jgi:hypothetical protein
MITSLAAVLILGFGMSLPEPARCSMEGGVQPNTVEGIRSIVRAAETIVRVRALEQRRLPEMRGFPPAEVEFQVLEVLKGAELPASFWMRGAISETADFSPGEVPYMEMRRGVGGGSCHAYFYARGAEFLLLLREAHGEFAPYWAPLMPTNEQVTGEANPWVVWVRSEIEASPISVTDRP